MSNIRAITNINTNIVTKRGTQLDCGASVIDKYPLSPLGNTTFDPLASKSATASDETGLTER